MLDRHATSSNSLDRRRLWLGRAASLGLGILCALLGQGIAGWVTGPGPVERLLTLPAALGLLLWLMSQIVREMVVLLCWPPRRPAQGSGGAGVLWSLLGFAAMLPPRPWLGWGLLGLAGTWVARAAIGRLRRRRAVVPPAVSLGSD